MSKALIDTSPRGFSHGVKSGNLFFMAGQTGADTDQPPDVSVIEHQTRRVFERMAIVLAEVGATLDNLVTMTVFITDVRYGEEFVKVRAKILGKDFPASALITVSSLTPPRGVIEIQAIAVLDD
ncbi:RidA family protein [Mycolicibacterium baixiangningiae]|uniref:RidA family protein n=1 Tax=Mycolicibacterium baixiangningiae TaxID=2761578 RepID=UPI0018D19CAE|nr:RidA family protein [Mycolicibacterium baixiangningiae]